MNKTKTQLKVVETGDFADQIKPVIHRVANSRQLFDVYRLTYESYSAQGSDRPSLDGIWIPHPDYDHIADTAIFVAELDGQVVGTISITKDGPQGLPMARRFFYPYMFNRASTRKLAQVWRLLVRESCPLESSIVSSLLSAAADHLLSEGIESTLFFVQEKHAEICRECLKAVILLRVPTSRALPNACNTLLRTDLDNLACRLSDKPAAPNRPRASGAKRAPLTRK